MLFSFYKAVAAGPDSQMVRIRLPEFLEILTDCEGTHGPPSGYGSGTKGTTRKASNKKAQERQHGVTKTCGCPLLNMIVLGLLGDGGMGMFGSPPILDNPNPVSACMSCPNFKV